jgi:anti-anti-sigma factor
MVHEINHGDRPGTVLLEGEIDLAVRDALRAALDEATCSGERVVVDMGGVTFIDSSGLHELMNACRSLNGAAPLVLDHVPPGVVRLCEIVGMDRLASIEIRPEA